MKQFVAIYDKDVEYANRLIQYLRDVKNVPFQLVCFTNEESLFDFSKGQFISILLVNEMVLTERIQMLAIQTKIIMREDAHKKEVAEIDAYDIYKYQSAEILAQKLLQFIETKRNYNNEIEEVWNQCVRVIGIYPLMWKEDQFAITIAQELSKTEKVFYCDLGSFSCVDSLLGNGSETDLSDAIYYMNQGNLEEQLVDLIQSYGNMEYISAVRCPEDLRTISAEDIMKLLKELVKSRGYETIVLSLAECMYMPIQLLSICNIVYVPMKNSLENEKRKKRLLQYLENNGKGSIWDKMYFLTIPACKEIGEGVPYVEQLLWSDMGDFVRRLF